MLFLFIAWKPANSQHSCQKRTRNETPKDFSIFSIHQTHENTGWSRELSDTTRSSNLFIWVHIHKSAVTRSWETPQQIRNQIQGPVYTLTQRLLISEEVTWKEDHIKIKRRVVAEQLERYTYYLSPRFFSSLSTYIKFLSIYHVQVIKIK